MVNYKNLKKDIDINQVIIFVKQVIFIRLGELRTITRNFDNRLIIKVVQYTDKGNKIFDVAFDMSNDNELYLRIINED